MGNGQRPAEARRLLLPKKNSKAAQRIVVIGADPYFPTFVSIAHTRLVAKGFLIRLCRLGGSDMDILAEA